MPKRLLLAGACVLASLLLGSGPTFAHAALVGTDPADGARLTAAPISVTLTFNEIVAKPAFVAVTAPDGSAVRLSKVRVVDKTVNADLASVDMKGTYTLSYRVVSSDSHPIEGSTSYDVTTGRTVEQVQSVGEDSFVHEHKNHLLWGAGGAVLAIGLLLWPLRSKND